MFFKKKVTISEIVDTFQQEILVDKIRSDFKDISTNLNSEQIVELIFLKMFLITKSINDCLLDDKFRGIILDEFHKKVYSLFKNIVGLNSEELYSLQISCQKRYKLYYSCFDGSNKNFSICLGEKVFDNLKLNKDSFAEILALGISISSQLIMYANVVKDINNKFKIVN